MNSGPFDLLVVFFLLISISLFLVDSLYPEALKHQVIVDYTEKIITCFFIIEYILRLFVSRSIRVFFFSHLIDLLAIIPLFRFFRLFRVFRLLKFIKNNKIRSWINTFIKKSNFFTFNFQEQFFEVFLVSFLLVALLFVGTIGILAFEKGHNEQFESVTDGLWWTVVTLTTVGYGDKFPLTIGGRLLAIFLMLTGLGFFALITSFFSSFIIERYRKGANKGMELATLSKHIIVCGWNSNANTVLYELDALYNESIKFKVIICESLPDYEFNNYSIFLNSDFTKMEVLEKAKIEHAEAVIILADKLDARSDQDVDARTILTVLGIKKRYPGIYVCAEIVSKNNIEHIQNAGADEYISSFEYTGNLLAHSVANRGITKVYSELLSSNIGSQLVNIDVNNKYVGKYFIEAGQYYNKEQGSVLIGIERDKNFLINPGHDFIINKGDRAVLIAQESNA